MTKHPFLRHDPLMTDLEQSARDVQRHFPRIYIACHVDHRARRGRKSQITARDQTILAHVPNAGLRPQALARHLSIAASTLSEALKRLVAMGLVTAAPEGADGRAKIVRLTESGRAALSETSVLDHARVMAALGRLSPSERKTAVRGLELLADAAQALNNERKRP